MGRVVAGDIFLVDCFFNSAKITSKLTNNIMEAHVTIKIPLSLVGRKLPPEKDIRSVKIEDGHLVIIALTEVPDHLAPIILTDEEYLKQKRDGTLFSKGK